MLKIKNTICVSGLTVRNDKHDRKEKEVNVILKKKCYDKNLNFVDNRNINLRMLNKSGFHLNEYGTTQLVINFCFIMKKWQDETCLGSDFTRKKIYICSKNAKKKYLNSSVVNTDRTIISKTTCPEENLDDANRSFKNNKECSNAFQWF